MESPKSFVGLDVGGRQIKGLAFAADGSRLAEEITATVDDGTMGWLERARNLTHRMIHRCAPPVRVGVAAPGLASADRSTIAFMPGRLSGLEGLDWQQGL